MYCMYICASDTKKRMISFIPLPKNCFTPPSESGKQGPDLEHLSPGHTWQRLSDARWGISWEYHGNASVEQGMGQRYSAKFELSDWVQRSDLELTEKYQSEEIPSLITKCLFSVKHSSSLADNKQPRSLLILFAICCPCPCYDVPWAMDMAFMLWYLTRDAPPNNNYWPSMSHCSVSRLIILHISGLFHPFIFSQFENEAPRVWADPQKKQEILIFLTLQTFFLRWGFLALHFRLCICLRTYRVWWEHGARFYKSCCISVDRI